MSEYPEAEKWAACGNEVRAIINFLQWVDEDKHLLLRDADGFFGPGTMELIYEYFEIDDKKLEDERRTMLDDLRGDAE